MEQQAEPSEPPSLKTIAARLPLIFPEGVQQRNYVVRDIAARTVFVMLYAGAIEGANRWVRPDQITKMSDVQSRKTSGRDRARWVRESLKPGGLKQVTDRWYAANTRESIRDETIRQGLIATGAAIERRGLPTTSSRPRYALASDFAALFDETLDPDGFFDAVAAWQERRLTKETRLRAELIRRRARITPREHVLVKMPNGEVRSLAAGPSSDLTKDVVEVFAPRFLREPAVILISESGKKIVDQDGDLARRIGLEIDASRLLPDLILADLGRPRTLILFVEVVVTDGAITEKRRRALLRSALRSGFLEEDVGFLSVFGDRADPMSRKLFPDLAWNSQLWFSCEPDCIVSLQGPRKGARMTGASPFETT